MSDEAITTDPNIRSGEPCIAGTRIPVSAIQAFHRDGYSVEQIMAEYPGLTAEQIAAAVGYVGADVREAAIEAAIRACDTARRSHCGFYYMPDHVIRDLRQASNEQEVWRMPGCGADYPAAHDAMMAELDRIQMRAAIAAYEAALTQPIERAPRTGNILAWSDGEWVELHPDTAAPLADVWADRTGAVHLPKRFRPLPTPPAEDDSRG